MAKKELDFVLMTKEKQCLDTDSIIHYDMHLLAMHLRHSNNIPLD